MMRQVYFDNLGSYEHWGLFLSRVEIQDPEPKLQYVEVPFRDGQVDLTEALTENIFYENRECRFTFTLASPRDDWEDDLRGIRAFLNGKRRAIRLSYDAEWIFYGRSKLRFEHDGPVGILTVTAICDPYRLRATETERQEAIGPAGSVTVELQNSRRWTYPTITSSQPIQVTWEGKTFSLPIGTTAARGIRLREGLTTLQITGPAGTQLEIRYREGVI